MRDRPAPGKCPALKHSSVEMPRAQGSTRTRCACSVCLQGVCRASHSVAGSCQVGPSLSQQVCGGCDTETGSHQLGPEQPRNCTPSFGGGISFPHRAITNSCPVACKFKRHQCIPFSLSRFLANSCAFSDEAVVRASAFPSRSLWPKSYLITGRQGLRQACH